MPKYEIRLAPRIRTREISAKNKSLAFLAALRLRGEASDISLSRMNFSGELLSRISFRRCDFTGSQLQGAIFVNVTFTDCSFKNLWVNFVKFHNCSFYGTDFSHSHLHNCQFNDCSMPTTPARQTIFSDCSFRGSLGRPGFFRGSRPLEGSIPKEDVVSQNPFYDRGIIAEIPRSDGYIFRLLHFQGGHYRVSAGCRFFSMAQAKKHWKETRGGTPLGRHTLGILSYFEGLMEGGPRVQRSISGGPSL